MDAGEYRFEKVPVGTYDVYVGTYKDVLFAKVDATVTVYLGQTTAVPVVTVPRPIRNVRINGGDIVKAYLTYASNETLALSWNGLENTARYEITVDDQHTPAVYESQTPVLQLGQLAAGYYLITIDAYDPKDLLLGTVQFPLQITDGS